MRGLSRGSAHQQHPGTWADPFDREPTIRLATVLRSTYIPSSRRSMVTLGEPEVVSEACQYLRTFSSSSRRQISPSGPDPCPCCPAGRPTCRSRPGALEQSGNAGNARSSPSPTSSTRSTLLSMLRHEEGCCFSQELIVHPQLGVLPPQPVKSTALIDVELQGGIVTEFPGAFASLLHPPAQQRR